MLLATAAVSAQDNWQDAVRYWLTTEDMGDSNSADLMEQLEELAQSPINLNQTNREELEMLPFLTSQQAEGIAEYLNRYVPLRSLNELLMVKALDLQTLRLLKYFVIIGPEQQPAIWPTMTELRQYGKHDFRVGGKLPFYERQGDKSGYLGYKYRHDIRYQFTFNQRIKAGFTAAQDAGEPFFADKNSMGYDQYNFYLQLRNFGRLEELNIGHYRVQLGMGLLMNTRFQLGKLATLQNMGRSTHTLTAHSSRSAANHLQGVAATVRLSKQWRITAFASHQAIDATLNSDGTARTLLFSGYHRTPTEMDKKHNTQETDLGGSIGWQKGTLHVHANAVYTHYDRPLQPQENTPYRTYAAQGNNFLNVSIDYGWQNRRWTLSGETALNRQGALATIHSAGCRLSEQLSLMLLHRYYDKRYTALHGNSFREGSGIQNEHGIYLGTTWQPSRNWQLQAYADYAHFSWPRYQVSDASDAFDALVSSRHTGKQWAWGIRYRFHIKQHDDALKQHIINQTSQRLRLTADWTPVPALTLHAQGDGVIVSEAGKHSRGIMVSQHVRWEKRRFSLAAIAAWFHSDDYDSRLYHYEPSTPYDFSFPAYYGHGLRYALLTQVNLGQHVTIAAKFGMTNYFDRNAVGTGLQQVDRSSLADLLLQLHVRL